MNAELLKDHINSKYEGNKAAFARAKGTSRQQIQTWILKGFIVVTDDDGMIVDLYSKRRSL